MMAEVKAWQAWEVIGLGLPNPQLLERVMITENLLLGEVTYEVTTRWEAWDTGLLVYHVGVVFKQDRNVALMPLRVSEQGDNPREAMHKLVMFINDLTLAGVLCPSAQRPGLYFDAGVDIPHDLRNRVEA